MGYGQGGVLIGKDGKNPDSDLKSHLIGKEYAEVSADQERIEMERLFAPKKAK